MASTSGTYNFQSVEVERLIRKAFEYIGISGEFIEPVKLDSARTSINLILLEWMNDTVNLWTRHSAYLPLVTNQARYLLPSYISKVIQCNLRTSIRQLNGTPNASSGIAANAFDGNPNTACTQTAASGNISYDYGIGNTQQINFIGIQSNESLTYSLVIETSNDNINWSLLYTIPPQIFTKGINVWFDIPIPINARAYRIRETLLATLNIQEIYFNNNIIDLAVSEISKNEYYSIPVKQLAARPSIFYFDYLITPSILLWPTPMNIYNCLQYTYEKMMEDVGLYTNTIEIPSKFYPALIWGLAYQLALQYNPQIAESLKIQYTNSFTSAARKNSEETPLTISPKYDW